MKASKKNEKRRNQHVASSLFNFNNNFIVKCLWNNTVNKINPLMSRPETARNKAHALSGLEK